MIFPARSCAVCTARLDNVLPGPFSNRIGALAAISVRMPAANRTGSRACRAQYPDEAACSAPIQSPVTVDTQGTRGSPSGTRLTWSINGAITGSIMAEWKACDVCSRR